MKRLNTKLDRLESQTGTDAKLSPAGCRLLVEILAKLHALFWPWRWTLSHRPPMTEIVARQRDYAAGVVGIAVKAAGRSDWKTSHELRQSLIASGHLTATHGGGQITSMFLTPLGEAVARGLVGDRLHSFHGTGVVILARLKALVEETNVSAVAETVLWGRPCFGDPSDWNDLTEMVLPCIVAGLVKVEQDTVGRIVYIPIPDAQEPPEIGVDVQPDETLDAIYLKAWDNERATLSRCEPRDPDDCFVANPANYPFNFCDVPAGEKTDEK